MPPRGEPVLLSDRERIAVGHFQRERGGLEWFAGYDDEHYLWMEPTHWQPLPELPK